MSVINLHLHQFTNSQLHVTVSLKTNWNKVKVNKPAEDGRNEIQGRRAGM